MIKLDEDEKELAEKALSSLKDLQKDLRSQGVFACGDDYDSPFTYLFYALEEHQRILQELIKT